MDDRLGRIVDGKTTWPRRYATGQGYVHQREAKTRVSLTEEYFYLLPPGKAVAPPGVHEELARVAAAGRGAGGRARKTTVPVHKETPSDKSDDA